MVQASRWTASTTLRDQRKGAWWIMLKQRTQELWLPRRRDIEWCFTIKEVDDRNCNNTIQRKEKAVRFRQYLSQGWCTFVIELIATKGGEMRRFQIHWIKRFDRQASRSSARSWRFFNSHCTQRKSAASYAPPITTHLFLQHRRQI
jgi:hypothetical protein